MATFLVVKITDKSQKQSENIHFLEVMYDFHQSHTSISNILMRFLVFFFFRKNRTKIPIISWSLKRKKKKRKEERIQLDTHLLAQHWKGSAFDWWANQYQYHYPSSLHIQPAPKDFLGTHKKVNWKDKSALESICLLNRDGVWGSAM